MKSFSGKYTEFFRTPQVPTLMAVALFSRMPMGMVPFAMLMFLREALGSFALAGSAVGAYFVAMAIVAPINGRIIDRLGPRIPLAATGIVQPFALVALLVSAKLGLGYAAVLVAAAVSGAFNPPISVLTRSIWRHRFDREEQRRMAFSVDAVLIQLNYTVGPAITAALLTGPGATVAYAVAIVAVVASFVIFVISPAPGYLKREAHAKRHMLGPLTEPRLLIVYAATFGFTVSFGLMEVGYPGFAIALAMPAFGGVLLSINSLGAATGGALYGGMHVKARIERQFAAAMGLMALPLFLHAIIDLPGLFAIVAFFAGAVIAPVIASQLVLVSRLSPAKYATEAFTWGSTFIVCGHGAGIALGGVLVEATGAKSVFAMAGAVMCAMAVLALLLSARAEAVALGAEE